MLGEPHSPAPQSPSHEPLDELPPAAPDPDWLRAAVHAFVGEWRAFFAVTVAVTLTPRRFAREWAEGQRRALNPLACALNAYGITIAWRWLVERAMRYQMPSLIDALSEPLLRIVLALAFVGLVHLPLRWMGGRARWRTTIGVIFFASAGPMLIVQVVTAPLMVLSLEHRLPESVMTLFALPQLVYYVLVEMGAHRLAWWRTLLALCIYIGIVSVLTIAAVVVFVAPYARTHPALLQGLMPDMR